MLKQGSRVNLERALPANGRNSGHFVQVNYIAEFVRMVMTALRSNGIDAMANIIIGCKTIYRIRLTVTFITGSCGLYGENH